MLSIRRLLTATPLAKRHSRFVDGLERRRIPTIPWDSFDRSRYPTPALRLAVQAQSALALGEYTAIELFAKIASGLALLGAPIDLVQEACRIPSDEARHAEYALRFASLCAGSDVAVGLDPSRATPRWERPSTLAALDAVMVEVAAIGETLAAALLSTCRWQAKDPVARALFSAVVADEVHHARLGWYYLAWRKDRWTRAEQQHAADCAGRMLVELEPNFSMGRDAPRGSRVAAKALGVLDSAAQRRTLRLVVEDEIVPGLDALGLGASHAWRVRKRVTRRAG
jgi:hypothetical protein